jgi:hypothetical protein
MATLPNHRYGEVTVVIARRGWEKRRGKKLKHLADQCPRCIAEREIARRRSPEAMASGENY